MELVNDNSILPSAAHYIGVTSGISRWQHREIDKLIDRLQAIEGALKKQTRGLSPVRQFREKEHASLADDASAPQPLVEDRRPDRQASMSTPDQEHTSFANGASASWTTMEDRRLGRHAQMIALHTPVPSTLLLTSTPPVV